MSTDAYIAMLDRDGNGQRIELRMDGYPTWAGARLLLHYQTEEQVQQLINLGNLFTLGNRPGPDPGAFINAQGTDKLGHLTRSLMRDTTHFTPEQKARQAPQTFRGGLDGIVPRNDQFPPYTYAWTPDGWFGAVPVDECDIFSYSPLLTVIHDYHRLMFEDCVPDPARDWGPYMLHCTVHDHAIRLLNQCLPRALLPAETDHPNVRLEPFFPPTARQALDEAPEDEG